MMRPLPFLAAAALLASASAGLAANARNPYGNVDRRVDAGNDTGNSEVDRLNEMQLDRNYRGPRYPVGPGGPPPGYAAPPGYAPPPGYGAPPPGYGAPPRLLRAAAGVSPVLGRADRSEPAHASVRHPGRRPAHGLGPCGVRPARSA